MSNKDHSIHDQYFRLVFGKKKIVEGIIEEFLPKEVEELIDKATLIPDSTQYIEDDLKELFSDVVWSAESKGCQLKISLLLEHKSYKDDKVAFQLLRYMANILHKNAKMKEVPLVVPIVLYHGKTTWRHKGIIDFYNLAESDLKRFVPNFDFVFINIQSLSNEALLGLSNIYLQSALLALGNRSYGRTLELVENSFSIIYKDTEWTNFLRATIVYLVKKYEISTVDLIKETKKISSEFKNFTMSTYDMLIEEGRLKGVHQGEDKMAKMIVLNLSKHVKDINMISEMTGLPADEIEKIIKEHKKDLKRQ